MWRVLPRIKQAPYSAVTASDARRIGDSRLHEPLDNHPRSKENLVGIIDPCIADMTNRSHTMNDLFTKNKDMTLSSDDAEIRTPPLSANVLSVPPVKSSSPRF
jgi:hypothetical protein